MQMLAEMDPELAVPADRVRPLGGERWEMKVVIDDECQRGLEQLKGLLSHVDPHMTLGQLVGRLVREGLDRHDPGRPGRARRTAGRTSGAERPSAPKQEVNSHGAAESAERSMQPAGADASPGRKQSDADRRAASAPIRSAHVTGSATSPAKTREHQDRKVPSARKGPAPSAHTTSSAPKSRRDSHRQAPAVAERASRPAHTTSSAPKAGARAGRPSDRVKATRSGNLPLGNLTTPYAPN